MPARRMRVLVVSDVSGYMPGGVPAETVRLLAGLRERGHAVALAGDIALGGAGVGHFPISIPTGPSLGGELQAALDAFRPDLVHVMAMGSRGISRIAPTLAPHPWVFTCHSAPPYERKLAHFHGHEGLHYGARFIRYLPNTLAWRWLLRRQVMPHVIVHSAFVREIVERYGSRAEHTSLIPLAYQPDDQAATGQPQPFGSAPQIVTVGGIAHTKGQHDMIRALAAIVRDYPAVRYKMIGEVRDPSYAAFLHRTIARLGLQSNVQLLEGLSHARKNEELARADLYVQPSHEEGFCLAFIEAAGVVGRLIGTDTGAIRAICEGDQAARVVPVRSPERISAALLTLLKTPPEPEALRRRRSRLGDSFGWPHYLLRHEELYARVTERAQRLP